MIILDPNEPTSLQERVAYELYDCIIENRRDDAIAYLRAMFPKYDFRSVAEQRNLFPGRVPA